MNIAAKMESQLQNDACSSTISLCYKSFDEFKSRIYQLKLSPSWNIAITADNIVKITCSDDIHIVPLFEIFCDESLSEFCCGNYPQLMKSTQIIPVLLRI